MTEVYARDRTETTTQRDCTTTRAFDDKFNIGWAKGVEIPKLSGSEPVSQANVTVQDFWAWAYSDILSNRNRSVFAEFLVAVALDLVHQPRVEWDAIDLRYGNKKIEVKSSAYLQSWQQRNPSLIKFDIGKKRDGILRRT